MIGIDTNVLLRCLINDNSQQNEVARRFLATCNDDDPAFVSAITLAETFWVLHRQLKYSNDKLISVLGIMLATDGLVFEFAGELELLLNDKDIDAAMVADYLVHWSARRAGCVKSVTFDKRAAAKIVGMELLS
jgi:predicted nucleic-acid-binding protein